LAIVTCAVSPGAYDSLSSETVAPSTRTIGVAGFDELCASCPYCRKFLPHSSVMQITYVVGSRFSDGRHTTSCQPRCICRRTDQLGCGIGWKFRLADCALTITSAGAVRKKRTCAKSR